MKPTESRAAKKRRVTRVRHAHDASKTEGLSERMLAEGTVCLEVDKVFADLNQLKDFAFLEELSVRKIKRGIATIGTLEHLTKLSLWEIRALDFSFARSLRSLQNLHCYGVKFKCFCLPAIPNALQSMTLRLCNGFGGELEISDAPSLEFLFVEGCGNISSIADCGDLENLRHVSISNIRDLDSLSGIAKAPNLESIVVQLTPNLCVSELEWMLHHPSLVDVYPLLDPNIESSTMQEAIELLSPKFGADLFDKSD